MLVSPRTRALAAAFILLNLTVLVATAEAQRPPDIKLTTEMNRQVVEGTLNAIAKYYVSAEVARRIDENIRGRLEKGEYDRITSAFDLVDALDMHLQEISKDPHLAMGYGHEPQPMTEGGEVPPETPEDREEARKSAQRDNFGFEKLERLAGNVGYIDVRRWVRPEFSGSMTAAVMTFVANTDALIIDLRNSRGGSPDMVLFLASYFFGGDEPFHLGDMYVRVEKRAQQYWTFSYVPGSRYLDKDVYILVSKRTFSAPEGFTSFLQHHKRATVVGEPTRGGTHPGLFVRVHPHFALWVPTSMPVYPTGDPEFPIGRPVYPATRTVENGIGVKPDLATPADQALKAAHLAALERLGEKDASRKEGLASIISGLKQELGEPQPKR